MSFLSRSLRLQPDEGARAGWMVLYSLAAVGGVIITGSLVGRALFLSALPAEDIPYKYLLPPLVLIVVSTLYARLSTRWRRPSLIYLVCLLSAVGIVITRSLLATESHSFALLCGLYVFIDVISALVILQFWTFAGDLFTAREARRIFPLITAGSTLSNLVFGLGLSTAASSVDPGNLLWVMVISLAVIAGVTMRLAPSSNVTDNSPQRVKSTPDRADLHRHPLLPTIAGLVLLVTVVSNIADYQLDLALQRHYGDDTRGMLGFLGGFRFWSGVGACALQFLFARRLLERFGVGAALLLLPIAIAGGSLAIILTGGALWAVSIPRGSDVVLKYTIHDASLNLLFLPIADSLRAASKAWIEGVLKPPVAAALALMFLWVGPNTSPQSWAIPVLVLVAVWLWLGRRAARLYVESLAQSLQMRRLDLTQVPLRLTDTSTIGVIRRALETDDPLKITQAISWIEQMGADAWRDELTLLAGHVKASVRQSALHALADADLGLDEQVTQTLRAALNDQDATVRCVAVDGLGERSNVLLEDLRLAADDRDAQVRYAALEALARLGDESSLLRLETEVQIPGPDRAMALAALAGGGHLTDPQLQDWLASDETDLLCAALEALPTGGIPPWQRLAQLVVTPAVRGPARDALRRYAQHDPTGLLSLCRDSHVEIRLRAILIRLLGEVNHDDVHGALLTLAVAQAALVRDAALGSLLNRRRQRIEPVDRSVIDAGLALELSAAERRREQISRLGTGDDGLLAEALVQRLQQDIDRVLMWCDLGYEELAHRRLSDSLRGADRRQRGAALELLDEVLDHEHGNRLLALLEEQPLPAIDSGEAMLAELTQETDSWLRAGALRAIGQRQLGDLSVAVGSALRDEEPRVREAAIEAVIDLSRSTSMPFLDDILADTDYVVNNPLCRRITEPTPTGTRPMPLSTFEKVFFLRSVPLFSPLTSEEIAALAQIVGERELTAGEQFITRGEEGDCLWVVVEGEARVDLITSERSLGPREVIGELAILAHRPRSADCFAKTDMLLLRIDQDAFWELLETRQEIAMQIMKVLVERYVATDD